MTNIEKLVQRLTRGREFVERLAHYRYLEAQPAKLENMDENVRRRFAKLSYNAG